MAKNVRSVFVLYCVPFSFSFIHEYNLFVSARQPIQYHNEITSPHIFNVCHDVVVCIARRSTRMYWFLRTVRTFNRIKHNNNEYIMPSDSMRMDERDGCKH